MSFKKTYRTVGTTIDGGVIILRNNDLHILKRNVAEISNNVKSDKVARYDDGVNTCDVYSPDKVIKYVHSKRSLMYVYPGC